jgi:hypothetical protein
MEEVRGSSPLSSAIVALLEPSQRAMRSSTGHRHYLSRGVHMDALLYAYAVVSRTARRQVAERAGLYTAKPVSY